MHIVSAIEQEGKYIRDVCEGSGQYRQGYLAALEIMAAVLTHCSGQGGAYDDPAVRRICSFAETQQTFSELVSQNDFLCPKAQNTLEIAERVLRSNHELGDYLDWWLRSYGVHAFSPPDHLGPAIAPNLLPPADEDELDRFDKELELLFADFAR